MDFMSHCYLRIGEAYFRTPRTTITAFVNLLSVLEQNAGIDWHELLGRVEVVRDFGWNLDLALEGDRADVSNIVNSNDDEFTSFKL
jgi:hypothetical protein